MLPFWSNTDRPKRPLYKAPNGHGKKDQRLSVAHFKSSQRSDSHSYHHCRTYEAPFFFQPKSQPKSEAQAKDEDRHADDYENNDK
jgi:hypothetical protein